jgi:ADP-L-glycero-D-manno-heptose 6-epimerase
MNFELGLWQSGGAIIWSLPVNNTQKSAFMKVLVTGHKGFIGQNIWKHFDRRYELVGYDWDDTRRPTIKGCDAVIHLGAISSTTERDVHKILMQNLDFSKWLFTECARYDVIFQYASSASIYGSGINFHESAPPDPRSPYAWSKYLFDRWVLTQTHNNPVQGYRYFNVYGPHEGHKGDQASPVHKFSRQASDTGVIRLFEGSELFKRDFVFVEDLCKVHEAMLQNSVSGIFNAGTGRAVSFADVAQAIASKYEARIDLIPMPQALKSQYQEFTCADNRALTKHVDINWTDVTNYIQCLD